MVNIWTDVRLWYIFSRKWNEETQKEDELIDVFQFVRIGKYKRKLQNSKTASEYESLYNFIDKARTVHKETDGIL